MRTNTTALRLHFQLERDTADPWGSVMAAWFEIADELYRREHYDGVPTARIPDHWQYQPGAIGPDPMGGDSPFAEACRDATSRQLVAFGNVLERYESMLRAAGRDY